MQVKLLSCALFWSLSDEKVIHFGSLVVVVCCFIMFTFSLCVCLCVFRTTNYAPWRLLWQKSDLITSNYCLRAPAAPTHPPPPPPHRTRRPSPPATRLSQMASFTHTSSETAFNFHQSVPTLSRAINSPCLIGISCMHSYVC